LATQNRDLLESLFRAAVGAAHPSRCLPPHLPEAPARGRLIVLAAGKAGGSLTEVAEQHYLARMPESRVDGIAVTRHGYGRPTRHIRVVEAGHPVPDAAGLAGAERMMELADAAGADDLVLVLLSGGASANLIAPAAGITLAEKQATTRALLRSGANIGEINCVRKHLSRIKGGRLAARAHPASLVTLAISDVPGDDPAVIGSGPTVPDPTTLADARTIAAKYRLDLTRYLPAALTRSSPGRPMRLPQRRPGPARPATTRWCSATGCKARRTKSRPNTQNSPATLPRRAATWRSCPAANSP
jgi:glycerate 2-kinase